MEARTASPEGQACFLSKITWSWLEQFISLGNKRSLKIEDLYDLNTEETSSCCQERWRICLESERSKKMSRVLFRFVGKEYILLSFLRLFWMSALVLQVYVIKVLIARASSKTMFNWQDVLLISAMFLLPTFQSLLQINLYFLCGKFAIRVKTALSVAVYNKMLNMKIVELNASSASLLNVFTNDIQKLFDALCLFLYVSTFGVNLIVVSALLIYEGGLATIPGILLICVAKSIQMKLANHFGQLWKRKIPITDSRIETVKEVLTAAKVVKLNGWVTVFLKNLRNIRSKEIYWTRKACYLRALMSSFRDAAIPLACLATFGVYIILHGELSSATAFTVLSFYSVLGRDFVALFSGLPACSEGLIAIERLEKLLIHNQEEENKDHDDRGDSCKLEHPVVKLSQCSFTWDTLNKTGEYPKATLEGIDLQFKNGTMVAITGKVGSGKTSLLLALLGEIKMMRGRLYTCKDIAYSSQQPWILNDTLRNNITFGNAYCEDRYRRVISDCALEPDISRLQDGNNTEIGERGINLSGGQKARISLARACYSNAPVIILDDPFSALDVTTVKHLSKYVFGKTGLLRGRTVIASTHSKASLEAFDEVYILNNGTMKLLSSHEVNNGELNNVISANHVIKVANPVYTSLTNTGSLVKEEYTVSESISLSTLLEYLKMAGWYTCFMVVVSFIVGQAPFGFSDYWLRIWTDNKFHISNGIYVACFAGIVVTIGIFSAVRARIFYFAALNAAMNIHTKMSEHVFCSPMFFFEQNPVGRIVNRFSKDQAVVDEILPLLSQQVLEYLAASLGGMCIISILVPWFLLAIPPFLCALIYFRQRYAAVCNELKRLDAVSRSPVYAHFTESMQGAVTIRAYGCQQRFHEKLIKLMDTNHKAVMLCMHCHRWLAVRLDLMATICITTVSILVVVLRQSISPGLTGVLLVQSFKLTDLFQYAIRVSADIENNLTSVERILEYSHLETEYSQDGATPDNWPSIGSIQFINYSLSYRDDLPPALHSISFQVEGMEKIGIVGRTGSGKSSLVTALFCMVNNNKCTGSILVDNIDIKSVNLGYLRQRLSIIPQEPVLFRGTLRFNLDPLDKCTDNEIYEALESVQLLQKIKKLKCGLDGIIGDNVDYFSIGECQLICLARSLLQKSKIVVLDEATASVDDETDKALQSTVRCAFRACTTLTIAHRVNTVVDSDRILVLENGRVMEFDTPANLLKGGIFAGMVAGLDKSS